VDIDDPAPECERCGFHIRDLDAVMGEPPARTGRLTDAAGALSAGDARRIDERIAALEARTGIEIAVATMATTAPRKPSEVVFWLFNRWRVGGERHAGVMILLAIAERRIESEVGYALEDVLTDEASSRILEWHAVPFLAGGAYGEGLRHAVDVTARVLENASLPPPEGAP
jgi:uncharacterized protein